MNKILQLFDESFVKGFFKKEVLPHYPDFADIKKIKIKPHKNLVWDETYHVVLEFTVSFLTKEDKIKKLAIFCSAHSNEKRKNFYDALKFLWDHNFKQGNLTIPHPLFYSEYFNAAFYRGIKGDNLHRLIKDHKFQEADEVIIKAAKWLNKLHKIPADKAQNFNQENSRIETVAPGMEFFIHKIKEKHPENPEFAENCAKIYNILIEREKQFLDNTEKGWLVHGDAHPENVIKISKNKLGFIDFTDLCLADFARDLGTFLQQLEYMYSRQVENKPQVEAAKDLFLTTYLNNAKIEMNESLRNRIETYYDFTSLRSAIFFLTKERPIPDKAQALLIKICDRLKINYAN